MDKRVLIISNECFEKSSANGRTLMNFLYGYDPEKIAQFYIHGNPDFSVCKNYYCVSDKDALNAAKSIKQYKKSGKVENIAGNVIEVNNSELYTRRIKKNCRNFYLRYLVWNMYRWWNKDFDKFLNEFNPECVLLQAGDAPFMYAIARKISKKFKVPLVMYNSENYVLKKKMYSGANSKSLWHKLLKSALKEEYLKFMKEVSYCIYSTEHLERCYQEWYPHPRKSTYMYISASIAECGSSNNIEQPFTLLYCGNLGVGRVSALCSLADALNQVDESAKLVICGSFVNDDEKQMICDKDNVIYKGIIPYEQVAVEISRSSMVVHCENPDRLENLKNAFSTKIADSLACGKPFLVYALREYPFVQYLEENNCAHIAENSEDLKEVLHNCISDKEYLYQYVANAKSIVLKNHCTEINSKRFKELIGQL